MHFLSGEAVLAGHAMQKGKTVEPIIDNGVADWFDLAYGEHACIEIENNRAMYWVKRIWAERNRNAAQGMRLVFAVGAALGIGHLAAAKTVTDSISSTYGAFWNGWDGGLPIITIIASILSSEGDDGSISKKAMSRRDKSDFIISATLVASAATVSGPFQAVAFAVCMWACFERSYYEYKHAVKQTDPIFLLYSLMQKYKAQKEQLKKLQVGSVEYIAKQLKVNRLKLQIESVFYQHFDTINKALIGSNTQDYQNYLEPIQKVNLVSDLRAEFHYNQPHGNPHGLFVKPAATKEQQALYKTVSGRMMRKQLEKVDKRKRSMWIWGLASVGMTLIAIAAFCNPATTLFLGLMIGGVAISGLAAAGKCIEAAEDCGLLGKISDKQQKQLDNAMREDAGKFIAPQKKEAITDDSLAPIRDHLLEMSHRKLKAGGIKDYVISLMCNDPEKVRWLYKRAHQYHTETRLIREQLRHKLSNELDGNPDEVDDKLVKQSMDTLTGNDRKAVLKDALERLASTPQHQHERRSSISASGSTADATR